MNCRNCHQPITFNIVEHDFTTENGGVAAAISKLVECPGCGTMNVRYLSYEVEFENVERPFAAVPTAHAECEDRQWESER
jgi:hypothetical protein